MENFDIIEKLGEGSYSTVYKVKRKLDDQIYALKKVKLLNLNEREKKNSLNEVRILASIKSKYVISYKEAFFDEKDSTLGMVMQYADNGDLHQKILEHKKSMKYFDEIEIWKIFIQIVKGLKALHDLQILHRDLKSANVFLFKNGSAKLGDLNVSKVAKRGLGYTQTGTPYYASPEIWKDLPYDNKSDIWSLGCVLYEMITLHTPFRAKNMDALYKKVLGGDIGKLPEQFSDDLNQIVQLLLKVNSNKRPNCNDILNNALVKKRIEFFNSMNETNKEENNLNFNEKEEQILLKTIRIPKNLLFLSNQLPQPNYKPKDKIETKLGEKHYPNIKSKKAKLPKLNINTKFNEESKNFLSIAFTKTKQISVNDEYKDSINNNLDKANNINNGNNYIMDIKNEVQFYKKLNAFNKKSLNSVKKNRSLDKNSPISSPINSPIDYINSNQSIVNHCNLRSNVNNKISNKYIKLYKLYEPNMKTNEVNKIPKYKILNSLRNHNKKINIFWKNREELYKDIFKNVGIKSELIQKLNKNQSPLDSSEGNNNGNYSQGKIDEEYKVYRNKNKLSPISYKKDYI